MRKFLLITFAIQLLTNIALAEEAFDNRKNLSGLWRDVNTEDFQKGYMIIAQDGSSVHVNHYVEWQGKPLVEYGSGERKDDTIRYEVTVTRQIPGWAKQGIHTLTLSEDGNTLEGKYETPDGGTGPLKFVRAGK